MTILKPIMEMLAAIFGYAAAKGIDAILGKWLARIVIAWEGRASAKAKLAFDTEMRLIKEGLPEKAQAWEDWRKRALTSS